MVTVSFGKLSTSLYGAPDFTGELGKIGRNGATMRIPFITTNHRFKQRISIVNRGAATTYSFGEFHTQDGVTAGAGSKATGTLPQGQTVLMARDVVEISGGTRAAATLSVVADPSNIDASVDIINPENGTVDTSI